MNFIYYVDKKNKTVFFCWFAIAVILTITYIIEYILGNRSIEYIFMFNSILWGLFLFSWNYFKQRQLGDINIKYIISICYLLFYTFVQFTSNSLATFVYIFPMLFIMTVYADVKLIDIISIYSFVINIIKVIIDIVTLENLTAALITFYEIQLFCLLVCGIILHMTTNIVVYGDNKLKELANNMVLDSLTQVYNRYFLETLVEKKFRNNQSVSLAIIDIDDFKGINDTYGHIVGDVVLKQLCSKLLDYTKIYKDTFVVRLGGDEFIILSLSLTKESVIKICRTLCEEVLLIDNNGTSIEYTISIGVANTLADSCLRYSRLYEMADKYLYSVKNKGKNSVCGWL